MSDNLTPVGVQVKVEGEKEYKDAVSQLNRQSAILTSEQRKLAAQFDRTADSQEALTAKSENLKKQIELQRQKIETIKKALENACDVYGENSKAADNWRIKLNNAERDLATLGNKLEDTEDDLRKLAEGAEGAGDELGSAATKAKKAGENIEDAGDNAKGAKAKWSDLGSTIKKAFAFGAAVTVAKELFSAVDSLIDSSMELNSDLSKFEQNVKDNNSSLGTMKGHLRDLTALTGETDSSIEALSNLMATGFNDSQTTQALEALSGAVIKFPDTLKIESLSDSLQETIATGKGVGQFSELIERSGYNLDKFNEQLAKGETQADRQRIALNWLSESGLAQVSAEYNEANKNMLDYKKAAYDSAAASAELAENLTPVSTLVEKLKAKAIRGFSSEIGDISSKVESTSKKITKYIGKFKTQINSTSNSFKKTAKNIANITGTVFEGLEPVIKGVFNILEWGSDALEKVTSLLATQKTETTRLKNEISDASDEWNSYKDASESALQETTTEINTLKSLQTRLSVLVDENGNLIGSEAELKKVIASLNQEGFNATYDELNKQIEKYDELNIAIEKTIKNKSYESRLSQMQTLADKANQDIYSKTETYNKALAERDRLLASINEKYGSLEELQYVMERDGDILGDFAVYGEYKTAVDNVTNSYNQLLEVADTMDSYENALSLGAAGDFDGAIAEMDKYFAKVQISTTGTNELMSENYQDILDYLEQTNNGFAKNIEDGQARLAQNQLTMMETTLTEIKARGGEIPQALIDSVNENLTKFKEIGGAVPEWLANGISDEMFIAKDAVQDAVNSASNVDTSKFITLGKNISNGVASGIRLATANAVAAAQTLVSKVNKKIEDMEDINSPSKVTRRYGQYMGEGISLGLLDKVRRVEYAAERLSLVASAPISAAATSSFTVNNTNYFSDSDARSGNSLIRRINRDLGTMYSRR